LNGPKEGCQDIYDIIYGGFLGAKMGVVKTHSLESRTILLTKIYKVIQ